MYGGMLSGLFRGDESGCGIADGSGGEREKKDGGLKGVARGGAVSLIRKPGKDEMAKEKKQKFVGKWTAPGGNRGGAKGLERKIRRLGTPGGSQENITRPFNRLAKEND